VGRFIRQEPLQGDREELVDLSLICDEVVAMTRPLWAERTSGGAIELSRDLGPGATLRGITGELREALLNLVQNALDAMVGGGTLTLRTATTDTEVRLEVGDTGSGMSAEVRDRAFEPFFTTKGRGGTGLGLSEVYGIVKRHRGQAQIESMPGKGTTVRLVFPRDTRVAGPDETATPPAARRPLRVLLVEDHLDSREFMQALVASDGHDVEAVAGIQEAKQRLDDPAQRFDVVVTDIGLGDGSGWDLVSHVRNRFPTVRIGVVTGWEPPLGEEFQGDFILRKPVRTQELLALISAES
jgi:CheY-like chemotaxis protein